MLRSVAVPGWGQWTNGKHLKAGVVAAGEGYLIFRAFDWGHREQKAREEVRRHQDDPVAVDSYHQRADRAASHRRDFTWWSIFAGALSMGDAYVDAHLGRFDIQFQPQDQTGSSGGKRQQVLYLGLGLRLP